MDQCIEKKLNKAQQNITHIRISYYSRTEHKNIKYIWIKQNKSYAYMQICIKIIQESTIEYDEIKYNRIKHNRKVELAFIYGKCIFWQYNIFF